MQFLFRATVKTQRARIFAITWLAYAAFYLCRTNLSVAIPSLESSGVFTRFQLADILFAYSLAYTAGQLFGGSLGDRFSPRRLVTIGMLLSAVASFTMGLSGVYLPFLALAVVNGAPRLGRHGDSVFLMVRAGETFRRRRIFFVALGALLPLRLIRGSSGGVD